MKGLFAREIISCAKLHIFRQMAPNYTKKNVTQDSDFVRAKGGLLSKAHYTYSNNLLVINRNMLYKSLLQREIKVKYNINHC